MSRVPLERSEARAAWLFVAPFLILLGTFFVFAAARSVWFSLTDYDLFADPAFVGMRNYVDLATDELFVLALRNSVMFALVVTTTQTVLAPGLAAFVDSVRRGRSLVRTAFYFPSIVSSTVMTLIFVWLLQRRVSRRTRSTGCRAIAGRSPAPCRPRRRSRRCSWRGPDGATTASVRSIRGSR